MLWLKIVVPLCAGTAVFLVARVAFRFTVSGGNLCGGAGRPAPHFTLPRPGDILREALRSGKDARIRRARLSAAGVAFLAVLAVSGKVVFALAAAGGTLWLLRSLAARAELRRTEALEENLIETLGMLASSLRAGQSFLQALEYAADAGRPPLAAEFTRTLGDARLGLPLQRALEDLAQRLGHRDVHTAVSAINLARETGGNMAEILDTLASAVRERRQIRGRIRALTAQGRTSGTVMGCVPFLLGGILYLMDPRLMGLLFTTFAGNLLLVLAAIMVAAGMVFINKIVAIDI